MSITPDQIHAQIEGLIYALERTTAKEREQKPNAQFAENYNTQLALAKEAMPAVDGRRWPPEIEIHEPAMGLPTSSARYVEMHGYLRQMLAIVAEGIEPVTGLMG